MSAATDIDMAALQRSFEAGMSLRAMCLRFRVGQARIQRAALDGGWARPPRRSWTNGHALSVIQEAYEEGQEPIQVLCARFGLDSSSLFNHAAKYGWKRKKRACRLDTLTVPKALKAEAAQRALIATLYESLGTQIHALAERPEDEAPGALAQCIKTINDLRAALGGPAEDEPHDSEPRPDDIRRSLERRLDRLLLEEGYEEAGAPPSHGEPERGGVPVSRA